MIGIGSNSECKSEIPFQSTDANTHSKEQRTQPFALIILEIKMALLRLSFIVIFKTFLETVLIDKIATMKSFDGRVVDFGFQNPSITPVYLNKEKTTTKVIYNNCDVDVTSLYLYKKCCSYKIPMIFYIF